MKSKTAIVILNYKTYQDTINCIESIYTYVDSEKFSVIVVDNASGNQSLQRINEKFSGTNLTIIEVNNDEMKPETSFDILLIQSLKNNGYAAGNNIGLRIGHKLDFKYLLVLNNDTLFIEDSIESLTKIIEQDSSILCVGPKLLKNDAKSLDYNCAKKRPSFFDIFTLSYFGKWFNTKKWRKKYYYLENSPHLEKAIEVDIISGSCMLFDTNKLNELDFFEQDTFLYYEEAILAEKAKWKNYKMILEPRTKVIHLGAKTTKSQSHSSFLLNCEYQSLKLYLTKYRNVSPIKAEFIALPNLLFCKTYTIKNKIVKKC